MNTTTDQLLQLQQDELRHLSRIERQDYFLIGFVFGAFVMCFVCTLIGFVP